MKTEVVIMALEVAITALQEHDAEGYQETIKLFQDELREATGREKFPSEFRMGDRYLRADGNFVLVTEIENENKGAYLRFDDDCNRCNKGASYGWWYNHGERHPRNLEDMKQDYLVERIS
jgi:hypothetical protein